MPDNEPKTDIRRISTERMEEIFRYGTAELCPNMMAGFFDEVSFGDMPSRTLRMYLITDVYVQAQAFALRIGVSAAKFTAVSGGIERTEELSVFSEDPLSYLTELVLHCIAWRDEMRRRSTGESVRKAREYIEEKYGQDELSLKTIAAAMNFTPAYFSALFKKEMGVNFSEYLTRVRIDKAKQLLSGTGKMIYEIAGEVGFSDYRYFGQIFKRCTGMTPKQFRASVKETPPSGDGA